MKPIRLRDRLRSRAAALFLLGGVAIAPLAAVTISAHAAGPALRSVSTNTFSGSSLSAAAPAGESAGDVLIAAIQANTSGAITAPSGWTLVGSTTTGSDVTASFVKVAGSNEPSSYSWTASLPANGSIAILDYTGIDTTSPVNGWAGNSGSGTAVAPSVATTATTISVILVSWDSNSLSLLPNTPQGFTQRWWLHSFDWTYGADNLTQVAAGSQPAQGVTTTPGDLLGATFTAQQLALTVAGPAPTPTPTPPPTPPPTPTPTPTPSPTPPGTNAIQTENANPGDPDWYNFSSSSDPTAMNGYGSQISVNHGSSIDFYVTTTAPSFTMKVYRAGWYGGVGGRLMADLGTFPGVNQPQARPDPNLGQVVEQWAKTTTLNVPASWTTGVYLVKLTSSVGNSSFIFFVVRDDGGHEKYVFKTSTNTYQAYNTYGGTSLYNNNTNKTIYSAPHAMKVSYDRPYDSGDGAGHFLWWEYPMLRWLEKNGYDMTYITDVDLDTNVNPLTNHKAFLSVGHDEYWSLGERTNVENAINAGVNAAFFSGNVMYWQVRFENSDRMMVGYKDYAYCPGYSCPPGPDPMVGVNNAVVTTNWRSDPVDRPENAVVGEMFGGEVNNANYIVKNASHWVYAGTGFSEGQAITGIVGYEYDHYVNNGLTPAGYTMLSQSPVVNSENNQADVANSGIYTAASGARVFDAGTIQWSEGLDDFGGTTFVNPGIQRATANILANFGS